jgi:hypothetical protein
VYCILIEHDYTVHTSTSKVTISGTLIYTVTGSWICGATVTISNPGLLAPGTVNVVTAPNGTFSATFTTTGDAPVNAIFTGGGIYGPSAGSTLVTITPG